MPSPSPAPTPTPTSASLSPSPSIVGEALYALGYTRLIGKGATLSAPPVRGWIELEASTPASRYVWPPGGMQGSLAGERAFWHHKIRDVVVHQSNPLNLAPGEQAAVAARWGQTAYFDGVDPLYLCKPGETACAFDDFFKPAYERLYGADPVEQPVPPTSTPLPVPDPGLPGGWLTRLVQVEEKAAGHDAGLLAGRTRLETVEGQVRQLVDLFSSLSNAVAALQRERPGPIPVPVPVPPVVPTPPIVPPTPTKPGVERFVAPDFTVGVAVDGAGVSSAKSTIRTTDGDMVMRCAWDPAIDRYKVATLDMDVEIDRHHFTSVKGVKENLFWLAVHNNFSLIGYALLTEDSLVAVEGIGMKHGEKERKTAKGLEPGKYHVRYDWAEGGTWKLRVGSRYLEGSATGQLDFRNGKRLMMDIGYPDPASPEIPTPGWKFSNIVVTLER